MARTFSQLSVLASVLAALLVACAGKDNRFGILVRDVRDGTLGFQSRHSLGVNGKFHSLPNCYIEGTDGDTDAHVVSFINGWAQIDGLTKNTDYKIRCETNREIVHVEGRTFDDKETMVTDKGFSSSGEVVSGALDCFAEARVMNYHVGTGRLYGFSGGHFPCFTQFDGARWRSTRLDINYRSVLAPVPAADGVTFEDGTAIFFDDDVDPDTLISRGVLRIFSCNGVCDSRSLWTMKTLENMSSSGLSAARSADGQHVAVAAVNTAGSPRIRVAMCSSGTACGDPTLWSVFNFSSLSLDSSTRRTEIHFDAVGNLWVLAPSLTAPALACRAASFPCTTLATWRTGALNQVGANVNIVRQQRPAYVSDASGTRLIGPAGGGSLPTKAVFAAECNGALDCTALSGGRFVNWVTASRTVGLFVTDQAFFTLGVGATNVLYQDSVAPLAARWKRCEGSFSFCNDPGSTSWSSAAQAADADDHPKQTTGQQRGAQDSEGEPIGFFVDSDNDFVYMNYLRP